VEAAAAPRAASEGTRDQPAAAPAEARRAVREHNAFLDLVRTVAILRVLVWHTYGFAWISYFIASMPAMFFVAGSLMAYSLQKDGPRRVMYTRFRRLLVPLWAFAVVALAVMAAEYYFRGTPGTPLKPWQPLFWIFPIWDPTGSEWGVTWWAVLWYLRCMTWLILLSPILLWLYRRLSIALLGLPLGLVIAFERFRQTGDPVPWQFEDAALFGGFWILGFAYNDRVFDRIGTRMRALAALTFAAGAVAWALTQDVPEHVVNASYPMHGLVGLTWLFSALTAERFLTRVATRPRTAAFIAWINDRVFTIYLWHAAGLFAMYQLLWIDERPDWVRNLAALPIVLVVTFLCMLVFGWIEDIAARRRPHFLPRAETRGTTGPPRRMPRTVAVAMPLAAAAGLAALFGAAMVDVLEPVGPGQVRTAVPPSGVGLALRASNARILDAPPVRREPDVLPGISGNVVSPGDVQLVLDRWARDYNVVGAALAFDRADGATWAGATGIDADSGGRLSPTKRYWSASVTKTFTTALILQFVEEGRLSLDDRASKYVPNIAHSGDYTIRNLIQHTSGLPATDGVDPRDALAYASDEPLLFEPGDAFTYSSPGYFVLGLIIEKLTGTSYTQALHERLLDPLQLYASQMDEEFDPTEENNHPNLNPALRSSSGVSRSSSSGRVSSIPSFEYHGILWSSAGLYSTVGDLARWGLYLWDSDRVVSHDTHNAMSTFLPVEYQYAGLSTYPFCPCWYEDGVLRAERWGHYGRSGVLEYDPNDRISVSIFTSGTDISEELIVAYDDLSVRLRDLMRGREWSGPKATDPGTGTPPGPAVTPVATPPAPTPSGADGTPDPGATPGPDAEVSPTTEATPAPMEETPVATPAVEPTPNIRSDAAGGE